MKRKYDESPILDFGRTLIETNDLDPVYVALRDQEWPRRTIYRWLIAYWCFYSCGVASWLAEQENFWQAMQRAALNDEHDPSPLGKRWPRAKERRHFRGKQATEAVKDLAKLYPKPEVMVQNIVSVAPDYTRIADVVRSHRGFGPWITFKVADMLDRVIGVPVDFSEATVFMFTDPTKAAILFWRQQHGNVIPINKELAIHDVVEYLIYAFKDLKAPPIYDRPIGLQEVETVLCKWKSHVNGHYPIGNDLREVREATEPWVEHSVLAGDFMEMMP